MKRFDVDAQPWQPQLPSRPGGQIVIEIETLALEGFSRAHSARIAEAVQAELAHLLRHEPNPAGRLTRETRAQAPPQEFTVSPGSRPEVIAKLAAASIHSAITGKFVAKPSRGPATDRKLRSAQLPAKESSSHA